MQPSISMVSVLATYSNGPMVSPAAVTFTTLIVTTEIAVQSLSLAVTVVVAVVVVTSPFKSVSSDVTLEVVTELPFASVVTIS